MPSKKQEPTNPTNAIVPLALGEKPIRRHAAARFGKLEGMQVELDGKKNEHGVPVFAPVTLKPVLHRRGSRTLPVLTDPPDILPLYLSVNRTKFRINPKKGKEIRIRSLSEFDHDLIVTCNSYLYELKGARARYGMLTQVFCVLKKNEMVALKIGLTEEENICPTKSMTLYPHFPDGYLEIHHYRCHTPTKTNSDADWSITGKNQLVHAQVHALEELGHWKDVLRTKFETKEVRKRRADFYEKRKLLEQKTPAEIQKKIGYKFWDLKGKKMMIDVPYGPYRLEPTDDKNVEESKEKKQPVFPERKKNPVMKRRKKK